MREVETADQEAWRARVRAVQDSMRTLAETPTGKSTKLKSKEAPVGGPKPAPARRSFRLAFLPSRQ